ncbi:capsular biosynthesis protein [Faecalitalea cylindroides]|nr:capsular biosynthesis protein [Faecalitalea cylindroides]
MNEKIMKNDEIEIDLGELFKVLKKNIFMIIAVTFLCAVIGLLSSVFLIDKKYSSEATIYITPKVTEQGTIDYNSIQTNSKMVNNYMEILKGETILAKVANQVGLDSFEEVQSALNITNPENTELISISAETTDPELSQQIVSLTVSTFTEDMMDILNLNNVTTINEAKVNTDPVSPSKTKFTILGFGIGLVISCGYVCITYLFDKRLRTRDEAENFLGIPVLATVPLKK